MMNVRSVGLAERNVQFAPPRVVAVPAATSTEIFPDITKARGEVAQRYLQNVGSNDLYYSFGVKNGAGVPVCNNVDTFHGYLAAGQQLDCTHRKCVAVYSAAGTVVSTTLAERHDTGHNQQS